MTIRGIQPGASRPAVVVAYEAFSVPFSVSSPDESVALAVDFVYGEMRNDRAARAAEVRVEISAVEGDPDKFVGFVDGRRSFEARGLGGLLHALDNHLTVAFEHAAPRYYFIHAATMAREGRVTLIVGDSGAGKSTTSYALAVSGMDYLSDELAPVEPSDGMVAPYPRAICLKGDPPVPLAIPQDCLRTESTLHIRPRALGSRVILEPLPLARIVFVHYSPKHAGVSLRPLRAGEAALRLYRGALNQLAHPACGLDETLNLIRRAESFELLTTGIEQTMAVLGKYPG